MAHFFPRNFEHGCLPSPYQCTLFFVRLIFVERVRGVKILHHQRVLDFRSDVKKRDCAFAGRNRKIQIGLFFGGFR